jgi:hypothetical protein
MINISATMESVRFMFEKHLKKLDLSIPATRLKRETDYAYKAKVTDEVARKVKWELDQGKMLIEVSAANGISVTTAHKIKHGMGRFGKL